MLRQVLGKDGHEGDALDEARRARRLVRIVCAEEQQQPARGRLGWRMLGEGRRREREVRNRRRVERRVEDVEGAWLR